MGVRVSGQSGRRLGTPALAAALVLGAWLVHDGSTGGLPPTPSVAEALGAGPSRHALTGIPMKASAPTRVRIPALDVDAPVTGVGLDTGGHLATPPDDQRNLAGWYRDGVTPGQTGTALLVGHVDIASGPAVFYGLGALHRGDRIDVARRDGSTAYFLADAIEVYPKTAFPDRQVFGQARDPELRLITCGGGYTEGEGYRGNVVVYAHLTGSRRA
ncbi:class F sortase [Kitasatospora sp. NPDC052896]|uniref:class F sortase n=1 Tax=Kitasatospora sp. NPDC052896 TaxID=3364061 RepID=UPI0037C57E80